MCSVRSIVKVVAIVAAVVIAGSLISAQSQQDPLLAQAQLQKSRAIQAQIQNIEQDRNAFVHRLFSEWSFNVDPDLYDPWSELGEIAMKAPAWQLYGASLAGDYRTMSDVLRGIRGAGDLINSLDQPLPKQPAGVLAIEPKVLGSYTADLVFTPITPCRLVDTRGTGGRAGILTAGSARTFDLTTDGLTEGQGGETVAANCPGLPGYSHYGWAVNVTVTGYSGAQGWVTMWGYTGTEPTASVINYSTAIGPAVANGLTVVGCDGCTDDVRVKANGLSTHVIIDVMGYYARAPISTSASTRVAGASTTITAGQRRFVDGPTCPAGTRMVGSEVDHTGADVAVGEFARSISSTYFSFWMINNDPNAQTVTVYAICLDTPIVYP